MSESMDTKIDLQLMSWQAKMRIAVVFDDVMGRSFDFRSAVNLLVNAPYGLESYQ